jgi:serine/threonine protein kinase
MTLTVPVSKHLLAASADCHFLVIAGRPDWLVHAALFLKATPFQMKVGSVALGALAFSQSHGLFTPSNEGLNKFISANGIDPKSEESLAFFESRINKEPAVLCFHTPLGISVKTCTKETRLDLPRFFLLNIYIVPTAPLPELYKEFNIHAFRDLSYCLKYPKKAFEYHQKDLFHGLSKDVITAKSVETLAKSFWSMQRQLYKWLKEDADTLYVSIDQDLSALYKKTARSCVMYGIFEKHVFRGGYKRVHMACKITQTIEDYGVAFCEDRKDLQNELRFRSHPEIAKLLTKFDFHVKIKRGYLVPHTWANCGSLSDVVSSPNLIPAFKHQLALQLLQKMHYFHSNGALHLDLHSKNMLVNYVGDHQLELFINDVGTSILKTEVDQAKKVTTLSAYLAPELLARIVPHKGYYWDDVFSLDFSIEDRELSERFQIGLMLYEIYFGQTLYEALVTDDDIRLEVPLFGLSFHESLGPHLFYLDRYLSEDELADVETLLRDGFDRYYSTLEYTPGMPFYPLTMANAPVEGLADDEESEERRAEIYDSIFDAHFKDPTKRFAMLQIIDDTISGKVYDIYKEAHSSFKGETSRIRYTYYGKAIATLSRPIPELIPGILEAHNGIMNAFMPLLSLNPQERPSLDVILQAFEAKLV